MQRNGKLPHTTTAVLELPASQLQGTNDQLHEANTHLQGTNDQSQRVNYQLHEANTHLQGTNDQLQGVIAQLHGENKQLHETNDQSQGVSDQSQGPDSLTRPSNEPINVYRSNDTIERRFMAARITIETLLGDSKLQEALAPYGYTMERLLQGQSLFQQALRFAQQQRVSKGDLFTAVDARVSAHQQAHAAYKQHVALARIALRNDRGAAQKLDLSPSKRTLAGWVFQAEQFYTNALANPTITTRLASYGVSYAQLTVAQQQVAAVAAGIVTQQNHRHIAKEAKQERDVALRALNHWMQEFRAVARIALADQPQRLAQLGLAGG